MSASWRDSTNGGETMVDDKGDPEVRDPEVKELQRDSLRLIIESEKVLTALEDHVALLRTFVQNVRDVSDDPDYKPEGGSDE